jgi:hypothetical protein
LVDLPWIDEVSNQRRETQNFMQMIFRSRCRSRVDVFRLNSPFLNYPAIYICRAPQSPLFSLARIFFLCCTVGYCKVPSLLQFLYMTAPPIEPDDHYASRLSFHLRNMTHRVIYMFSGPAMVIRRAIPFSLIYPPRRVRIIVLHFVHI